MESANEKKLKALIVYFSATGNTEKVANTIKNTLEKEKVETSLLKFAEAAKEDLFDYDLVFLGSPSIELIPPPPVRRFVDKKVQFYSKRGDIKVRSPKVPGKTGIVFITYSGPHTGINEGTTAGKWLAQFFAHLGFEVAAEWYIVGEFHGREDLSTEGILGDIRGRPNEQDLAEVENSTSRLVKSILSSRNKDLGNDFHKL